MLTKFQINLFSQLDAHYKAQVPLEGESANMRGACEMVREFAIDRSSKSATDIADELIMPSDTPIAYVNGAVKLTWKHKGITSLTSEVFEKIIKKMLDESLSSQRISRRHFMDLRQEFFDAAQCEPNQCFNRFAFACYPTQFCSVVSPKRLRAVLNELNRRGLLSPSWMGIALPTMASFDPDVAWHNDIIAAQPDKFDTDEWYDLCETVVPILKEAFPLHDYAEHTCFLARMGKRLNDLGVPV